MREMLDGGKSEHRMTAGRRRTVGNQNLNARYHSSLETMTAEREANDDTTDWPPDLATWRKYPRNMTLRNMYNVFLWKEMTPAFVEQGVIPYIPEVDSHHLFWRVPPRSPEGILPPGAYETRPGTRSRQMQQVSASIYPAVLPDGSDVMLRVVSKKPGVSQQLSILRFLSEETRRSLPENHAIPVLRELTYQDWTFVAMPRYGRTPISVTTFWKKEWFSSVREMFAFVEQTLEAFAFLHDHLIAHQDISARNILLNHVGQVGTGFLSSFPARYYVIDFEHAVQFPVTSSADERLRVGPPVEDFAPSRLAPEIGSEPHCPFAADVWQLGAIYFHHFSSQTHHPTFRRLIASMISPQPDDRPTMRAALVEFSNMKSDMDAETLDKDTSRNYLFDELEQEEYDALRSAFLQGVDIAHVNHDIVEE